MQSYIRRQIKSFIIPSKDVSIENKKQTGSDLNINKKDQHISKSLTVHQFDEAVNLIFRPKRFVRPNKSTRPNPLTDRNTKQQQQKNQKQIKASSLEKSLSLLKRIKDFIVPQNLSFFKFNKSNQQTLKENQNLNLSISSKINKNKQKNNFSKQENHVNLPNQDLVAMKRMSGLSINSNDQDFFIIPQLKISLPKQSSKQQQSSSRKSSRIIQNNQLNDAYDDKIRKNSLMSSIISSKQSQKSQKSKHSPTSSLSKITNPNYNILKTEHVEGQKLKYFYILGHSLTQFSTTIYVLVGNENQVDCLCISKMSKQDIVDIELSWSLSLQRGDHEKGKITSIGFDALKSSYITLLSNDLKIVQIYRYSTKQFAKTPTFITYINIPSLIHTMHMVKQNQIFLFYESKFVEVFSIEMHGQVKKKYQKALQSKIQVKKNLYSNLEILSIGQPFMNSITIYLTCEQSQSGNPFLFDLFIIEISFQGQGEIIMSKPHRVYSIKKDLKPLLKFDNFSKRFFLLYVGLQIIAVMKEGYMIDSAKVDIQQEKSMLKYIGKNRLLLITQSKIQQYEFNLKEDSPPYRLHIKSLDSIILPENYDSKLYEFLDAVPIFQTVTTNKSLYQPSQYFTFYLLCFQLKYDLNKKIMTGQVPYLLAMTKPVSVKQKADKLFHFEGKNIQTVDMKQIQEKVDIAKKMGLKVKDIYLELWNRTKKNTVKDFCFLLDTLDYDIISKQIQKKLKKQAMLYTELFKIESSCFFLLKKRVFSPQCTETDIKHFIVSHFKLKKYYFFKDVSKFCENEQTARDQLKKPEKPVSSQSSLKSSPYAARISQSDRQRNDRQEKRLMFDIQAFYTYNQMELKSYLLQLFHKYFYQISQSPSYISKGKQVDMFKHGGKFPLIWAKKKDYLLKIKIMMNYFRFQLKMIYEQFLEELIKSTQKGDMIIELLNDFEQILPKSYNGQYQQTEPQQQLIRIDSNNEDQQIRITKKLEITKLRRSLSKSTQGQLQLDGIWRQISEIQYEDYLYLQNIETIYNKTLIQTLSKDIWFQRNLYTQHDLILKTKQEMKQIDKKLKSSYIFYFFIDRVYEYVDNETVRKQVLLLIDHNYSSVLPKHLKGKIELYYQLYLETKKLSKQYVEILHKQTKNPINQNAGIRSSALGLQGQSSLNFFLNLTQSNKLHAQKSNPQFKKSLYQTFLPPKPTNKLNHLDSFQNFLRLSEIQLFNQFIKLEYILVGCIFHRIKPVYEKFWKGREIFNETVQKYFESKSSQISHLKCLLNRLNSETKEFQAEHFDLYEVLVKSVMVKVQIGSIIHEKQYVNVDQLIIYIRDIYMINENKSLKKGLKKNTHSFSNSKVSINGVNKVTPKSIDFDPFLNNAARQSRIQSFFNILSCVSENKELFRNLNIRISLYDIYELHQNNRTEAITTLIVQYLIQYQKFYELQSYESFEDKTIQILVHAAMILNKLYASPQNFMNNQINFPFQDQKDQQSHSFENQLFFILLWKIMSYQKFVYNQWIFRLLQNKDIAKTYTVNEILKENLVIFMCKYRFSLDKLFVNNIKYLECLINLLPETNRIRKYFAAQIQFVKCIQPAYEEGKKLTKFQDKNIKPKIMNPLTENSEIISIFHIEQIFSLYPAEYLLKLNLERICEIVNEMQKILLEIAVKERLADPYELKNGQTSLIQSVSQKQIGFSKFERQNSGKFLFSMKKSLDLIEERENFFSACNTPIYTPQFDIPFIVGTDKEINLLELQTLIRQSAQPHTFFKDTQAKLIKSIKLIRQRGSLAFQSPQKLQERQKALQQKQVQESIAQFENLSQYYTNLTEIYQVVVKRLINSEMIKQVLQHLQKLLKLSQMKDQKVNQFYVVYPLLILNIVSRELVPENRILLVKICSHLFKEPLQMLKFIKQLIGKKDKNKVDFSELQSSIILYSMSDLNIKLQEYEKKTRAYKVQYLGTKEETELDEQYKKIEDVSKLKHKLKKELTIKIQDSQDLSQSQFPRKQKEQLSQKNEVEYLKRPFSYENPVIAGHLINSISSETEKIKFIRHIYTLFETLHRQKELFSKDFQFMIMNVMLFQQPYTIVKYLETKLKGWYFAGINQETDDHTNVNGLSSNIMIKFKPLMSYFNEMIKQPSINPLRLLEFGKRMFYMLYCTIVQRSSIEYQIRQYYEIPLTETIPCDEFPDSPISQIYITKFKQSIEVFSKKQKQIRKKMTESGKFIPEVPQMSFQMSKNNNQKQNLFVKQLPSFEQYSPNKFSAASKQDLLQISYNNIEDSLSQNLQTPLVSHNPSKISELSKGQESFDPSKQRQLVYSRGQKRFSAMLSNNSSIILKNKLSPKSIRSGKNPSISFFSSENSKIKKSKDKYFRSDKQIKKIQAQKKRTFDGLTLIQGNNGDIVYHHQQSIIFEQDFQNSRNISDGNISENFCIEPPKLISRETDKLMNSSLQEDSRKIEKSRNLVIQDMNFIDENEDFRWTQTNQFRKISNDWNQIQSIQEQKQDLLTLQPCSQKTQLLKVNDKNIPSQKKNVKIQQKNMNILLQEDQFVKMQLKQSSGCQFDADISVTHKKIEETSKNVIIKKPEQPQKTKQIYSINAPIKRTTGRNIQKLKIVPQQQINQPLSSQKNDQKFEKPLKSSPHSKAILKKTENNAKISNIDLSNELRKISKSIDQQKTQQINEFSINDKNSSAKNKESIQKQKIKFQREKNQLKPNNETKKLTRKVLTVKIPSDDIKSIKKQENRLSSQTQPDKIPTIIISPRNRSDIKPKLFKNLIKQNNAKQNNLLIKIKQLLAKNGIQMFLLTELQDIYEKFRDYWEKCQDIIPGVMSKLYQNENEIVSHNSRISQKSQLQNSNSKKDINKKPQRQSFEPKSAKISHHIQALQQDHSLQLSHSHQSYENEHEQIELLSNWQNGNYILQQQVLFTKQQLYELIFDYLNEKIKQNQTLQQQLSESQILLQQLKDKLFNDICMQRLIQNFTNENNVNTIAKIIDKVFGKKIYVTDYYYQVVSKKQVQQLQKIVQKVAEQASIRTFRYTLPQTQNKNTSQKQAKPTSIHKLNNLSQPNLSPRANSIVKNSPQRFDQDANPLQKLLEAQMIKLENLLQKIPLNILQYRKKELMLKLKPGKQMGRKYLLDVLVKVFEKKKDKKLAEEVHLRLKNIIDKDIKI